ncbi:MAG: ArsC/Spx/MgsR family protein, partial [Pseudomonadota bacterium]
MWMFGLKSCDTCRKARKALPDAEFVDVREQGVPAAVLEAALDVFGDALINTRSTTWRALSDEDRALASLALLQAHPTVMK